MRDSMEDDYGQLVGLGLPMWLFLIFFVLLSSVWGEPSTTIPFPVLSILVSKAPRNYVAGGAMAELVMHAWDGEAFWHHFASYRNRVFVNTSAWVAGWCVWFFTVLAGAALLVLNTKLVHIVRYVTRGGHVHRLKPGVFWLNRRALRDGIH